VTRRLDRRSTAACVAAALFGGAVYLNALHNPFVYDDYHTVVANPSIARLGDVGAIVAGALTRPLVNFTYAIDRAAWGTAPFGFHVTNVLLHMANVVLLFLLTGRLMGRDRVLEPFAAASLFAVHPMMTEAVGYISGRSELLCGLCFLLALLAGLRWIEDGRSQWAAAAVALWVASLAAKEIGAMFPFVLLAADRWLGAGDADVRRRRLVSFHLPLIAATLAAGLVRLAILARIEHPGGVAVHWSFLPIALDVIRRYVTLLVYPTGQTVFHAVDRVGLFTARGLTAVAVVALLAGVVWRLRRTAPIVSVGLIWFLLLLVPSSALLILDQGEPMAEHRVYLASCGLFLAVAEGIGRLQEWASDTLPRGQWLAAGLLTLVLASFGAETLLRNAVWKDPVNLWGESVLLAPTHYRPRLLLGEALQDAGRLDEAAEQYQTAIRLRPEDATGRVKLGQLRAASGRVEEARQLLRQALAINPSDRAARESLDRIESGKVGSGADGGHR
jgi:hypothetical protein